MSTTAPPSPLRLAAGDWEAELLPAQGATFAALRHRGRDLIVPIPPGADPIGGGGMWGAFWMIPWVNRLDHGRLPFGGQVYHLPINRPQDDTAIHGLARDRPWQVESAGADRAVLTQTLDDASLPVHYAARIEVALGADTGVALAAAVTNHAATPFPLGLGWHPFYVRPPRTRLAFRAATRFGRDARTLPIDPRPSTGIDGEESAWLDLDTCFAGWDGRATIAFPESLTLRIDAHGAWAKLLQVYAPPHAAVLCVEPQSHMPDAPNRPALAAAAHGGGAMSLLAPGESLTAWMTISAV
jgi:aldose 1-epimerase